MDNYQPNNLFNLTPIVPSKPIKFYCQEPIPFPTVMSVFLMTDINFNQKQKASFRVLTLHKIVHYFFEIFGKDAQGTIVV